jgi:hypothetical protein
VQLGRHQVGGQIALIGSSRWSCLRSISTPVWATMTAAAMSAGGDRAEQLPSAPTRAVIVTGEATSCLATSSAA